MRIISQDEIRSLLHNEISGTEIQSVWPLRALDLVDVLWPAMHVHAFRKGVDVDLGLINAMMSADGLQRFVDENPGTVEAENAQRYLNALPYYYRGEPISEKTELEHSFISMQISRIVEIENEQSLGPMRERNSKLDQLFSKIHANKHRFTLEAVAKAFSGVRRRKSD